MVVVVADVTESQQAIVRVTPADGMQPFTMQSKEDRKKERKREHGRNNNKKKQRGEKLITITNKEIYTENQFAVFLREVELHKTPITMNQ